MFIAWSDADADWVEEIEIVSSFECEYVFNPLGGLSWAGERTQGGQGVGGENELTQMESQSVTT